MERENNLTKLIVWMELHDRRDDKENILESHQTSDGKKCVSTYLPLLDKRITVTEAKSTEAFDKLFETCVKEIDEYLKDKPELKNQFETTVSQKLIEDKIRNSRLYEKTPLEKKFEQETDEAMDHLGESIRDAGLILDEDISQLYVKVVGREFFGDMNEDDIFVQMDRMAHDELRDTGMVLLYNKIRVFQDTVILFGIFESF